MKKFFSLVLALVMALSLTTVAWGADCTTHTITAAPTTLGGTLSVVECDVCGDYVVQSTGSVTLTADISTAKRIFITDDVEINLGGFTITGTGSSLFRIHGGAEVTFSNGTIANTASGGRCIETRGGDIVLNLDDVDLTATSGASQPLTVGGSGTGITVNITNTSSIDAGTKGYAITTFNPVTMNITSSTVSGFGALNIKAASSSVGSAGSTINVVKSTLSSANYAAASEWNTFATIMVEDDDVTINVDKDSKLVATEATNGQVIFGIGNALVTDPIEDVDINVEDGADLEGAILGHYDGSVGSGTPQDVADSTITVPAEYADEMAADGYVMTVDANGQVVATGVSAAAPAGGTALTTLYDMVTTDAAKTKTVMVTVTTYAAKAPKDLDKPADGIQADEVGNVAYMMFSNLPGQYFVQVNSVSKADYTVYYTGTESVFGYFDKVDSPFYYGTGVAFYNFGDKCGQWDDTPVIGAKYYTFEKALYVATPAGVPGERNLMVGTTLTPVNAVTPVEWVGHVAKFTYDKNYVITAVECAECGTPGVIVPNYMSLPKALQKTGTEGVDFFPVNDDDYYYWLAGPVADTDTETDKDDKVTSAETFDAGIAMYVGMSVMAAAGSAVVIGKKKD